MINDFGLLNIEIGLFYYFLRRKPPDIKFLVTQKSPPQRAGFSNDFNVGLI